MQPIVMRCERVDRAFILLNHVSIEDRAHVLSVVPTSLATLLLPLLLLHELLVLVPDIELIDD